MAANGANAVWLGHNNPGEVDANKLEPGMSYAVYAALIDENDPHHADAKAMADAIKRALDAARATKLKVILPIGYQIQMGTAWNAKHPNDLRVGANGEPLSIYNGGISASPYSSQYRADITRYYEWVQREYVDPYQDVIVMLSLADEPMGGDYSNAAKNEFARRYGESMDAVPADSVEEIGEFQSGVIADYAAWSANEWKRINPGVLTTISFHGGDTARRVWGLPDYEKLFAETPDTFVVTFDAYLHDDIASKPATSEQAEQLKLFLGTIGHLSHVYQKPLALWGGVNAWGLAQESASPLGLADAVTNLRLLYDVPTRAGGTIWGIFAWNYNVRGQGLENYDLPTTYASDAMMVAVEKTFPTLRSRTVSPAPSEIALWVSPRTLWQKLGQSRAADIPPEWFDTTPYARVLADRNAVIVNADTFGDLAPRYLIVTPQVDLDAATLKLFRDQIARGGVLLAPQKVIQQLQVPAQPWNGDLTDLPDEAGVYQYNGE